MGKSTNLRMCAVGTKQIVGLDDELFFVRYLECCCRRLEVQVDKAMLKIRADVCIVSSDIKQLLVDSAP